MSTRSPWTTGSLLLAALLFLWTSANINWGGEHWRHIVQADAKGYHAYLPAILLYGDPNLGFFDAIEGDKYHDPNLYYDYRSGFAGHTINKYYAGTALAQLPFFLAAHALAPITGHDADGFSKPYAVATNLAAIAWVLLGLYCLAALLTAWGVSDRWRAFTLLCFAFGTNLFYYTVVAPGMSHAYSFGVCTALFLLAWRWEQHARGRELVLMGALLGLIVLIRPVNALVLLALPCLWSDPPGTVSKALKALPALLGAVVLAVAIPALQLLYYKLATGHWLVYSYGEEGFRWSDPHLLDILFSYRKGLFLYTPLLLLALVGLQYWWQRSKGQVLRWAGFLLLLTYVLSSWWNWWYGGSFGSRVYVEYLALFAVPFALALQGLAGAARKAFVTVAVVLVLLCQFQTYQARYSLIHWEDMDRARYWDVFLRSP